MTVFTFANNVDTTLASAFSSSATSFTLASTAHLPPSIPVGEYLVITLNDAATRGNYEVIYVGTLTGATCSNLLRAQEGTAALSWLTGDYAYCGPTDGQMVNLLQVPQATGRFLGVQVFAASGSAAYTPTAGATKALVQMCGAAGAGGGAPASGAGQVGYGSGGHSGAAIEFLIDLAGISSVSLTVGTGGVSGSAGQPGGAGSASIFGTYGTANGGPGGQIFGPTATASLNGNASALPGASTTQQQISNQTGNAGFPGMSFPSGAAVLSGSGGLSPLFGGSTSNGVNGQQTGNPATQPGQGGSGGASVNGAATAGGPGGGGYIVVFEYGTAATVV